MNPLWMLLSPAVYAEAPAPAEGVVAEVVVAGTKRVDEAAILDVIGLRSGERVEPWKVQRDLRAVWRTGFVQDVSVRFEDAGTGVRVVFVVTEKPAVREVSISGAKKIKEDDIREVLDIEPFTVPSDSRIASNVRAIRDKYLEKGYFLVEITPVMEPVGDGLVELTFEIVENRKVVVQSVDITGNEGVPDAKIRRYMQTRPGGIVPWLTSKGTYIQENLEADVYAVRSVFLEEGYVEVQVDAPKVYLSPDKRYIYVDIHVTEGPKYQLGEVKVQGTFIPNEGLTVGSVTAVLDGATLKDVQAAHAADIVAGVTVDDAWSPDVKRRLFDFSGDSTPLRPGDDFRLTTMQAAIQRVTDLYGDQGYAFANVVPLTATNPETRIVDITFDVQPGEKMRIGRINITGNDPTFDKVIRREIPINEGEIYRGSAIRESRARLDRLGYFEKVDISTPRGDGADVLDMNVDVTERPTGSFSVGAGYGSLDSWMFTANIQKANFIGLGYLMSLAVTWSPRTKNVNVSFADPHVLDTNWTGRIDGYYVQQEYLEDQYQRGGKLEIGRYLDERNDIRLGVNYTFEDVGILSLDDYKKRLYGGELYRNGLTSSVGLVFEVDKRNNRISATRGVKFSASSELAGGFRLDEETRLNLFGGDFNLWETQANFRFYQPVVQKGDWLVFKYNMSAGYVRSTDGSIVPFIHRYRAGGITSIRGYENFGLGPSIRALGYKDYSNRYSVFSGSEDPMSADDRLIVGGTETFINNFELESPVIKAASISLVAFFDAGNTFGDPWGNGHIDLTDLRTSYGFGLRWFSPIGPLRFELGFPINPHPDERKSVFDFTIGSAF